MVEMLPCCDGRLRLPTSRQKFFGTPLEARWVGEGGRRGKGREIGAARNVEGGRGRGDRASFYLSWRVLFNRYVSRFFDSNRNQKQKNMHTRAQATHPHSSTHLPTHTQFGAGGWEGALNAWIVVAKGPISLISNKMIFKQRHVSLMTSRHQRTS